MFGLGGMTAHESRVVGKRLNNSRILSSENQKLLDFGLTICHLLSVAGTMRLGVNSRIV